MSAAIPAGPRSKIGAEPRKLIILGALLAVAIAAYFYNSDDSESSGRTGTAPASIAATGSADGAPSRQPRTRRRVTNRNNDRGSGLRITEVTQEAQRGEIDPTLRLDLLARLKTVSLPANSRNLFEASNDFTANAGKPIKVMPGPMVKPPPRVMPLPAAMNPSAAPFPLKFYGFVSPVTIGGARRGFFLESDNVVVAREGDLLGGRYRVVALQATSAKVEDVSTKQQQTVELLPEDNSAN